MITAERFTNTFGMESGVVLLEDGQVVTAMSEEAAHETLSALRGAAPKTPFGRLIEWVKAAPDGKIRTFNVHGRSTNVSDVVVCQWTSGAEGTAQEDMLTGVGESENTVAEAVDKAMLDFIGNMIGM